MPKKTPADPGSTIPSPNPSSTLFFHNPSEPFGQFSQWHPSPFTIPTSTIFDLVGHHPTDDATIPGGSHHHHHHSIEFNCAEQFMMYCKASRFRDTQTRSKIMATRDPKEQKLLGKQTAGFDAESWDEVKFRVVVAGNMAKFGQNPKLKARLLGTGERELAEAAKRDRVWGIGYHARLADKYRKSWGWNLLGKALMEVRGKLREEEEEGEEEEGEEEEGEEEEAAQGERRDWVQE
ncbi:hypothetical protein NKR19_g10099 [Coniochaeta hoffmannii]|uniref:NADAR domain-containing protein n=1 Tax=Coniochaeta hoffmannii TaxID=91930 RepID=A0AA38VAX1_9PEZI|nr:hypothetical protein NKR19_g10099 [Coniochaeta hoffmannii]